MSSLSLYTNSCIVNQLKDKCSLAAGDSASYRTLQRHNNNSNTAAGSGSPLSWWQLVEVKVPSWPRRHRTASQLRFRTWAARETGELLKTWKQLIWRIPSCIATNWKSSRNLACRFINLNTDTFPFPEKAITVSQPVKACSPGKACSPSKLLWCLLTLNPSILSLIWSGTAYFVVNYTNTFLPGDHDQRASWRTCATHFWRQTTSFETQNVHIFPFVYPHDMFLRL